MQDQDGINALRMTGLIRRVFEPDQVPRYKDVIVAIELWEARLREWKRTTGTKEVHESLMVHSILKIVPAEMRKDI